MLPVYNLFIRLYYAGICSVSFWNKKAEAWVQGRRSLFENLQNKIADNGRIIWVHCSSAGEFEQAKPLIEAFKINYPRHKIVLSFFSPSGFEAAKNYPIADYITYLPLDTQKNAKRFVAILNPELVVFIKYEFWYHLLSAVAVSQIPLLLVSAVFRPHQVFFKPYGIFFRKILLLFRHIFTQDQNSMDLLHQAGAYNCSIAGDTRFDRVKKIAQKTSEVELIQTFIGNSKVIVAGSTWHDDEMILADYVNKKPEIKLILAPHRTDGSHISSIINLYPQAVLYSEYLVNSNKEVQVLVINSVGLLSRLYSYATVAFVGGGFTRDGIHNILEAAVWGKPVLFGPNFKKYREAGELIKAGGGFCVRNGEDLHKLTERLFANTNQIRTAGDNAKKYVEENTGATKKIITLIHEKRLLTN